MKSDKELVVAVIGLGFGAEFVPIYLDHPNVKDVVVCDENSERLNRVRSRYDINRCYKEFNDLLGEDDIDAIHIVSGIPDHAWQSKMVLAAGKHCACTVPMATSIQDLHEIIAASRASSKNYMMMETAVYTRQFLYLRYLKDQGYLGRIQFLRGAHYQDMECWPKYWDGIPPMWYATHAISPLLAISETRAKSVHCYGSGIMRPDFYLPYKNPFPIETAIFQLEGENLCAEVTRSLYHCARDYMESFIIYGENACYEWQMEKANPVLFIMSPVVPGVERTVEISQPEPPDRADLLPESLGKYTRKFVYSNENKHLSFTQGGGHHGSHPHMVHEFVSSIVEKRTPWIDALTAANWTAAGICAHESAMGQGKKVEIPLFE